MCVCPVCVCVNKVFVLGSVCVCEVCVCVCVMCEVCVRWGVHVCGVCEVCECVSGISGCECVRWCVVLGIFVCVRFICVCQLFLSVCVMCVGV